jgi:hypothetical protein
MRFLKSFLFSTAGACSVAIVAVQNVPSAQYPDFLEIGSFQHSMGRNHGAIRKPDVVSLVFFNIQTAEGNQP